MEQKYFKLDTCSLQSTLWNTSLSHPCGHESLDWNGMHVKLKADMYFHVRVTRLFTKVLDILDSNI